MTHSMHSVKQSFLINKSQIGSLLILCILLLLLPLRWLIASLIAALIHELGHYTAVYIFGGTVHKFNINASGAIMKASGLNKAEEFISLFAGPLAGFIPMIAFRTFPTIALCGMVQSLYNLLPISPLDGGKMLNLLICEFGGSDRCFHRIENLVLIVLGLLCVYIFFHYRVSLFLFLVVLVFRKTPCKTQENWI